MTDQKLKIDFANPVLIDLDGTRWIADHAGLVAVVDSELRTPEPDVSRRLPDKPAARRAINDEYHRTHTEGATRKDHHD